MEAHAGHELVQRRGGRRDSRPRPPPHPPPRRSPDSPPPACASASRQPSTTADFAAAPGSMAGIGSGDRRPRPSLELAGDQSHFGAARSQQRTASLPGRLRTDRYRRAPLLQVARGDRAPVASRRRRLEIGPGRAPTHFHEHVDPGVVVTRLIRQSAGATSRNSRSAVAVSPISAAARAATRRASRSSGSSVPIRTLISAAPLWSPRACAARRLVEVLLGVGEQCPAGPRCRPSCSSADSSSGLILRIFL